MGEHFAAVRQQPQGTIVAFRERSQAFSPLAVVGKDQSIAMDHLGAMDVPTDYAVQAAPARVVQTGLDVARDVALGRATAALEEFRQRPVALTAALAQQVEPAVAAEDAV